MTSEQPARVLVVADDEQTVSAIREALGTDGVLVGARHLDAAFAALQEQAFDHVLLLPAMAGEESTLLQRLREVTPQARIVLLDDASWETVARALPNLLRPLPGDGSRAPDSSGGLDVRTGGAGSRSRDVGSLSGDAGTSSEHGAFPSAAREREAAREVERTRQALRFVAGLSRVLSPSLTEDGVVAALGPLVVPAVADRCVLDLVDLSESRVSQRLRRILVFPEPSDEAEARALRSAVPERDSEDQSGPLARLETYGCWSREGSADLGELLGDSRFASALRALDLTAVARVPVIGTEGQVGIMTVARTRPGRPFDTLDQEILSSIADHLSVALENARRVSAEREARSEAERATERMRRVQTVTASLSQALLPERVAEVVVTQGIGALGASAGLVMRLDESGTSLRLLRAVGYASDALEAYQNLTIDAPFPLSTAVRRREAVWIESPREWTRAYPDGPLARTHVLGEAWAAIPLLANDQTIGVLGLSFPHARHFDDAERGFVSLLADQCAQALLRAAYYEGEWDAQRRLAVLADASKAFATFSLDLPVVLETITRGVAEELGGGCIIFCPSLDESPYDVSGVYHPDDRARERLREALTAHPLRADVGLVGEVLRSGAGVLEPLLTPERARELLFPNDPDLPGELEISGLVAVPLRAWGRLLGVLVVWREARGHAYTRRDESLLEDLADRAALAIDNARHYYDARNAIRVRDEFLSVAAHELKTPLTSLRATAQLELRRLERDGGLDPARVKRGYQIIDQQSAKLARLTGQLLDVSRLELGKLELETDDVDVASLIRDMVDEARGRAERHCLAYAGPERLDMVADPVRLEQVVANLIDNAIKYSPNGGDIVVEVALVGDDQVRISVTDSGVGIAPEHREHIFDRFYQAHVERHYTGLGLGLYVCREIIERHGGTISAEFPEAGGTQFVVWLPRAARASGDPESSETRP